jgi:Gram-negative bacterial TonB protein C-terminal
MKLNLVIVLCLFATISHAQGLKKQKLGNELYQEIFSVFKSNKKIRHGDYQNFKNGNLNITGQYESNKKIGEWKFYEDGILIQTYDYSKGEILLGGKIESNYEVFEENQFLEKQLPNPPSYIGGNVGLERSLNDMIKYPEQTRRVGLEGTVSFSVLIPENGEITDIEFLQGPSEFYSEIKRALSNIEQTWIPGSNGSNKVKCKLYYAIEFKLLICGAYGCSTIFIK